MNTIIQLADGTTYDLDAVGITTRDFVISSPSYQTTSEVIEGRHGAVTLVHNYGPRNISASFYVKATDSDDYASVRDSIFRIFRSAEPFYLIESRNPGKRWLVHVDSPFAIEQQQLYGFFTVGFVADSGYAESPTSTLNPIGGIQVSINEPVRYRFSETSFAVWNEGEVAVDPRSCYLKISFKGQSNGLTITNITTGDTWRYNGSTGPNDVVVLDGVRSTKNGISIFGHTNRKLITLAPKVKNRFSVMGAEGNFEISFDFRFIYI